MKFKLFLTLTLLFLLGMASTSFASEPFPDVSEDHWAYEDILKLKSLNILEGYPDGLFKGGDFATRYEMGQALYRLLEYVEGKDLSEDQVNTIKELEQEYASELETLRQQYADDIIRIDILEKQAQDDSIRLDQHQRTLFLMGNRLDTLERQVDDLSSKIRGLETAKPVQQDIQVDPLSELDNKKYDNLLSQVDDLNQTVRSQEQNIRRLYAVIAVITVFSLMSN